MFFHQIPGQEEVKEQLLHEVTAGRMSHAQLFIGSAGYGGLALAHAFVAYVLCENRSETEPCGECDSCKQLKKLAHPDVHYSYPTVLADNKTADPLLPIWRKMNIESPFFDIHDWTHAIDEKNRKPVIGVEESQNIIKKLSLKSYQGKHKIMMIWMADMMNTQTANKLLKIIEEPPDNTLFILLAESQEQILPTVLSRTQMVKIPPIEDPAVEKYLLEELKVDFKEAALMTKLSQGNLNDAIKMAKSPGEKNALHQMFVSWMRMCYSKKVPDMIDFSNQIGTSSKEEQQTLLKYSLHVLRQAIVGNYKEELMLVTPEEKAFLEKFAQFITGNNIVNFLSSFSEADFHITRNANAKIIFLNLSFDVMRFLHKH